MRLSQLLRFAKKKFPELKKETSNIKWLCCSDPEKKRDSSGNQVWMSWCMYQKGEQKGGMNRIVGRPKKPDKDSDPVLGPKPTTIKIDNKTMPKCP